MEGQASADARLGEYFRRNGRVVSIIGALIVFATFVVKDALREHLKDLTDSINSAQSFYELREENSELSNQVTTLSGSVDQVQEDVRSLIEMQIKKRRTLTVTLDDTPVALKLSQVDIPEIDRALQLIRKMPNQKNPENELSAIRTRLKTINDEGTKLALSRHESDEVYEEIDKKWSEEAFGLGYTAHSLIRDVVASAELQADRDERRYQWCTNLSYVLYTLGWGLTLAGRLFNIEGLVVEE